MRAKDFIGTKLFDGKIEVIDISHVDKRKITHFKVKCSECAKDPELFGEGIFISRKDNLEHGKLPCGCSKTYRYTKQQILILINRVSGGIYRVVDFPDTKTAYNMNVICESNTTGEIWKTKAHILLRHKSKKQKNLTKEHVIRRVQLSCENKNYKLVDILFNGKSNSYSEVLYECPTHGIHIASYSNFVNKKSKCPQCAGSGYTTTKEGSFYIVKWFKEDHSFLKFGITNRDVEIRVAEQKMETSYNYTILYSRKWRDGKIPLFIEDSIKYSNLFDLKVIDKLLFPDGFTETINISDLEKLILFVENKIKEV